MNGYLKPAAAAERLGLHLNTVRRLIKRGHLRAVVLPGLRHPVVPEAAIAEYMAAAVPAAEAAEKV